MIKSIVKALLFVLFWSVIILLTLVLSLFVPIEAHASSKVMVDQCHAKGYYTLSMTKKVKANKNLSKQTDFDSIEDFCQQTFEELYPQFKYREINARIRKLVE